MREISWSNHHAAFFRGYFTILITRKSAQRYRKAAPSSPDLVLILPDCPGEQSEIAAMKTEVPRPSGKK